jgi:hypothetical protein
MRYSCEERPGIVARLASASVFLVVTIVPGYAAWSILVLSSAVGT